MIYTQILKYLPYGLLYNNIIYFIKNFEFYCSHG